MAKKRKQEELVSDVNLNSIRELDYQKLSQAGVLYQLRSFKSVVLEVGPTILSVVEHYLGRHKVQNYQELPRHLSIVKLQSGMLKQIHP